MLCTEPSEDVVGWYAFDLLISYLLNAAFDLIIPCRRVGLTVPFIDAPDEVDRQLSAFFHRQLQGGPHEMVYFDCHAFIILHVQPRPDSIYSQIHHQTRNLHRVACVPQTIQTFSEVLSKSRMPRDEVAVVTARNSENQELEVYLKPTEFIESEAEAVLSVVRDLRHDDDQKTAIALFDWVRDTIHYDPYTAVDPRERYRATAILERERGYCVQKAVLLAALGRASAIPTRLGFADVRNHKCPPKLLDLMGTNLFVFHGFVEFHIGGRWIKATPAFDEVTSRKVGVLPVSLDGENDAMFHPVDPEGHPFIEYIRDRGTYADLPFDELRTALSDVYSKFLKMM